MSERTNTILDVLVVEYVVEMRWNGSIVMEVESIPRSCLRNIILVKKNWKMAFRMIK